MIVRRRLLLILLALLPSTAFGDESLRTVIDQQVAAAWKTKGLSAAQRSSDAEFARRLYLDLLGVIPSYDEALSFLDDDSSGKRDALVGRLLDDPRFARHQADVWDMVYFGRNPPGFGTDKREGFKKWLQQQFAENVPYDQWAGVLLRAEGNTVEQGSPMFFVQYKNRPEDATEAITQKFLGVQLQCARCHDHPFDAWTQKDFYGVAAFFARLQVVDQGNKNKQKAYAIGEKNRGDVLFTGPASEQEPGKKGQPVKPKFLGGKVLKEPELPSDVKDPRNFPSGKMPPTPKFSRKDAFADWVASADNPYFARAAANRIWAQFLGKGPVHPVDNLGENNPPSHPQLLDALASQFAEHAFDVKWLIREIVSSDTYQLSSSGGPPEAKPSHYERARYRPLSAEELFESWLSATGYLEMLSATGAEPPERFRVKGFTWDYMRRFFGRPNDGVGDFQGGVHEHLYLNNGQIHQLITERKGGLFDSLSKSERPWEQRVERLYVQVLSRRPTSDESQRFVKHLSVDDDRRGRLHEAIWTLMTCSEFRFNH